MTVARNGGGGDDDRRALAEVYFRRARIAASTGNFDDAIEVFLSGLRHDPSSLDAHRDLREISLRRKAAGGMDMGMFEKIRLAMRGEDDRENLLNVERMLACNPGDTDLMIRFVQFAAALQLDEVAAWMSRILDRANRDGIR